MRFPFPILAAGGAVLLGVGVAAAVYAGSSAPTDGRAAVLNPSPVAGVPELSKSIIVFDLRKSAGKPDLVGDCGFSWKATRAEPNGEFVRIAAEIGNFSRDCSVLTLRLKAGGKETPIAQLRPTTKAAQWSKMTDLPDGPLAAIATTTGALDRRGKWETNFAREIWEARATTVRPYLLPVKGKAVPTEPAYVPNARRPYRAADTDGIHHSWDFYAPNGTAVRAVADGAVIRIRSGFKWQDFSGLIKDPRNEQDRATNLDVYRGNQVWLKDAQGHVWMYNHLGGVADGLAEGDFVTRGQILGVIGVSGVPDKDYVASHLDLSFAQNPHDAARAGTWTPLEIMMWPWWGKGMGYRWVMENEGGIFGKE